MTYTRQGDQITLEMSIEDYETLLFIVGTAAGAIYNNRERFWRWIDFTNRLNTGNPNFAPYEIPDEYRQGGTR